MTKRVDEDQILEAIADVVDPEVNVPILEMGEGNGLIDEIKVDEKNSVELKYHATTPYCPPVFAMQISMDIKARIKALKDVSGVKVLVSGHMMADAINQRINSEGQ